MNNTDYRSQPWTKLFAPTNMDDMALSDRISGSLNVNGIYEDMIFYGTPGTGKSQTAKILVDRANCLYINASRDGNIDMLRSNITEFAMHRSLKFDDDAERQKVVFLDEIDGASPQFFKALRGFMDDYGTRVRFLCTTNYINKIPDPIKSRFRLVSFDPANEEERKEVQKKYVAIISRIIKQTGIKVSTDKAETKKAILAILKNNFPDFRGILKTMQYIYMNDLEFTADAMMHSYMGVGGLLDLAFSDNLDPVQLYKYNMANHQTDIGAAFDSLGKSIIPYVTRKKPQYYSLIPRLVVIVCDYQAKLPVVIDSVLCLNACAYNINEVIKVINQTKK